MSQRTELLAKKKGWKKLEDVREELKRGEQHSFLVEVDKMNRVGFGEVDKGGRPVLWEKKEDLEVRIDIYRKYIEKTGRPVTMSGFAYFLGVDRTTIINYGKRQKFFNTIKRVRALCENMTEEDLTVSGKSPIGSIFKLKNNHKWKDTHEIESNVNININTFMNNVLNSNQEAIDGDLEELLLA